MAEKVMSSLTPSTPASGPPTPTEPSTTNPRPQNSRKKKRKRNANLDPTRTTATATQTPPHRTLLTPQWSYVLLSLLSSKMATQSTPLDALTVRTHLTAALTQFLGDTGAAVSVDIMKIEDAEGKRDGSKGRAWIRVPVGDLRKVIAAVGGWVGNPGTSDEVGWRVLRAGRWLSGLIGQEGEDRIWDA